MYWLKKQPTLLLQSVAFFFLSIILVIPISGYISYTLAMQEARAELEATTKRVQEDIKFTENQWDTTNYLADSAIPDDKPLYIIASNGFVVERWKPIQGFLDVVEFTTLLSYETPETVTTITNEKWRIFSKPIEHRNKVVGVITVTKYNPESDDLANLDEDLRQTVEIIQKNLHVQGDTITLQNRDTMQVPYNITYQVVSRFNKLLYHKTNNDGLMRSPSFIDNSYIDTQLRRRRERTVTESGTKKTFLIRTEPLYDSNNSLQGIIVAGTPVDSIHNALHKNSIIMLFTSLVVSSLFIPLFVYALRSYKNTIIKAYEQGKLTATVTAIAFNKKQSLIQIDEHQIKIPYASFQYYFCTTLFSKPQKKWETDEILDAFGEEVNASSWRKVYDAMTALNKKTGSILHDKLFIVQNKTFRINPEFTSKIRV